MARSHSVCPRRRTGVSSLASIYSPMVVELEFGGRVVFEENLAQADGPQRLGERFFEHAVFGADDFRAAAADIDHQSAPAGLRPSALHAQVNQARFLAAGDDFYRSPGGLRRARQEFMRIARVADGAGGDSAYAHHIELAVERGHARQYGAGGAQGVFTHRAGAKYALAQARHFAFRRQYASRLAGNHFGRFHADRVAADIDGCVAGHSLHNSDWQPLPYGRG